MSPGRRRQREPAELFNVLSKNAKNLKSDHHMRATATTTFKSYRGGKILRTDPISRRHLSYGAISSVFRVWAQSVTIAENTSK